MTNKDGVLLIHQSASIICLCTLSIPVYISFFKAV